MILTPEELEVLLLSSKVAATCLIVSLIPAILIAWILARKEFWGKSLFETLVFLPLVLPPVVPGYLLLQIFGNRGILGQYLAPLGLEFAFNWKGAVLASAVMGFPLLVQSIRLAIELVDQRLEMAAKTLGASVSCWLRTYPPKRPSLKANSGVSSTFASPRTPSVPKYLPIFIKSFSYF